MYQFGKLNNINEFNLDKNLFNNFIEGSGLGYGDAAGYGFSGGSGYGWEYPYEPGSSWGEGNITGINLGRGSLSGSGNG